MKNPNKQSYLRNQGSAIAAIALGVLLILNPDFGTATVGLVVGIVFAGLGVLMLVLSFMSWPVLGVWEIAIGVLGLLSGGVLIKEPTLLGKLLGYVIAIALLMRGFQGLHEAQKLAKLGYNQKWNRILALVMIVLGIILFVVPLTSSRIVMRLVGVAVVVLGVLNMGSEARYAKRIRASEKDIIDAEE